MLVILIESMMTDLSKTVFSTPTFAVVRGAKLPVTIGDFEMIHVDGYQVYNKSTKQVDGEFRTLADAMLYAVKWQGDIETAEQAARQEIWKVNYDEQNSY